MVNFALYFLVCYLMIFIRYLQEHCPLGTGGGLYHFRDQILSGNTSSFFVFNSDVCCDFPVKEMHLFQKETGGSVILGTKVSEGREREEQRKEERREIIKGRERERVCFISRNVSIS